MLNLEPSRTGFVIVDMQNDFLHPEGAYGKNGQTSAAISALPARLQAVANTIRATGGWIISTHFTLVPGKEGKPFISSHLKKMRNNEQHFCFATNLYLKFPNEM